MPTRKQRRRREKSHRHEWEYVEIDPETGEERPLDPAELKPERPERKERKAQPSGGKQGRGRSSRAPQPPSWTRVGKRTALFAPLMAIFIYYTQSHSKSGGSSVSIVVSTAVLILFFAPFSYLVDSLSYRVWTKRQAQRDEGSGSKKR